MGMLGKIWLPNPRPSARTSTKPHFCGAIVVDQLKCQPPNRHASVIDGQQRLTTFLVYCRFRDVCQAKDLTQPLHRITLYQPEFDQRDPESDQFKLKPTRYDSEAFMDVITFGTRDKIRQKYVGTSKGKAPPPKIASAYLYFYDQIMRCTTNQEDVFGSETHEITELISALTDAFISFFRTVIIMLDNSTMPKLFRALNSRGRHFSHQI
jgi:hypothetical protein